MKSKKSTKKYTFLVVLVLILALAYTAFFGIENYYGDTRQVYVKGAQDIRWGIDISGGVEAVFSPDKNVKDISKEDMDSAKAIIETRLVNENITDYEVYADNVKKQIIVRFPWSAGESEFDAMEAVNSLGETALLKFCANEDPKAVLLSGSADIASAAANVYQDEKTGQNQYVVSLKFTDAGMKKFAAATAKYSQISIWMDDTELSAPSVSQQITDNNAYIEGNFTAEQATDLANKINAGSLPFALTVDNSKLQVISPTLGADALNVMVIAGAIAFALICVLMIVRYRLSGVIASVALLGQLAGMIACISGFFSGIDSFTLTIPGIAGIILSVGVGVDANVISFERIREEFRNGKTIDGAIENGYKNSLSAVIDGNVTIVIVALVLMGAFGTPDSIIAKIFSPLMSLFGSSITGSIFSFGYTLLIGVIFNLIMGIVASKIMMKSVSRFKCFRNPWLYGGPKPTETEVKPDKLDKLYINTGKSLKPVATAFAAVMAVGIILTAIFGVNLDINFKGGAVISYSYTGNLDEAAVEKVVKSNLNKNTSVSFSSGISDSTKQVIVTTPGNAALSAERQDKLTKALQKDFKANNITLYNANSVSPSIAGSFFAKSLVAVLITAILVVIYIGYRFRNIGGVSAALSAFAALIIDCIIAFLACTAFRLTIDSNLIAVILTLLGYSLNDTIVIYDRVRENKRLYPGKTIDVLVDESINSVKTRNFITTLTTVLAITTIIVVSEIYGLSTLRSFAIPMAFGILSGCLSSLFISGPIWVLWKRFTANRIKVKK
ncbi:MAG: SecD/SecF family protein translocase subunit [Clostridia bacterium]|nr:SecD/SecF family protein translocase subunit [Clostridia bacterium]